MKTGIAIEKTIIHKGLLSPEASISPAKKGIPPNKKPRYGSATRKNKNMPSAAAGKSRCSFFSTSSFKSELIFRLLKNQIADMANKQIVKIQGMNGGPGVFGSVRSGRPVVRYPYSTAKAIINMEAPIFFARILFPADRLRHK